MARYLLDTGHCLIGGDTGSQGCGYREEILNREVGNLVKSKLEVLGHEVFMVACDSSSSLNESLRYRVGKANQIGGDLYISIHFNAFNSKAFGTELFTCGGEKFTEAVRINKEFENLGLFNRGIKDGKGLYVIKSTNMKALLVECCFIDNSNDMSKYNAEKFANAIVKGITGVEVSKNTTPEIIKPQQPINQKVNKPMWIKTTVLPFSYEGYSGTEITEFIEKYFEDVKVYVRGTNDGRVFIETSCISNIEQLDRIANRLNDNGLYAGVFE